MKNKKLRWCVSFRRSVSLRRHKRKRIRLKNINRTEQLKEKAFRKWGYFPFPF